MLSILNPINYASAAIFFIVNVTYASLPVSMISTYFYLCFNLLTLRNKVYLPTILNEAGFSSVNAQGKCFHTFLEHNSNDDLQGLSAPPYLAAWFSAIAFMFLSDRLRHRGLFIAFFSAVGGTGYIVLATCRGPWVRYGAIFLVAVSPHIYFNRSKILEGNDWSCCSIQIGCFTVVPCTYWYFTEEPPLILYCLF